MQAVAQAAITNRAAGRHQGLRHHLPAIYPKPAFIGGLAAEQIGFDLFQSQQGQQPGNGTFGVRGKGLRFHMPSLADFSLSTTSVHNSA